MFLALSVDVTINIFDSLTCIIAVLFALCVHEWAHAFAAVKCGDMTPQNAGRLTLNPIKHFDPIGFIMMLFVRVGYAKPLPINPYNFKHQKRDYILVSLAGIIANFLLACIFVIVLSGIEVFAFDYYFASIIGDDLFGYFLMKLISNMVYINVGLMIFNLLPIYPLDGFRWVEAVTKPTNKFRKFMLRYGPYLLLGLFLESVLAGFLYDITGHVVFSYLDILGNLIGQLSYYVIWPIERLFVWFWGLFI